MGMRINTNIDAINADRHLGITSNQLSKTIQKLSSGMRINSAADDAAGLAISERLRAQVRGNNQAVRNSQDGISLFQTAEGAMDEVHSMLQRSRELLVQGANGTLSSGDLASIDAELGQLGQAIDRIANTTQFNGLQLLNGTFNGGAPPNGNPLTLQVGPNANTVIGGVTITYTLSVTMQDIRIGTSTPGGTTMTAISVIMGGTYLTGAAAGTAPNSANSALGLLDDAINFISSFRGDLGAKQNALEHTISSLNVASENQAAAESRIRDLDVANETVNFTKLQILQQAGTAVLAQANVAPQTVLQLLR
jgi:flagellin